MGELCSLLCQPVMQTVLFLYVWVNEKVCYFSEFIKMPIFWIHTVTLKKMLLITKVCFDSASPHLKLVQQFYLSVVVMVFHVKCNAGFLWALVTLWLITEFYTVLHRLTLSYKKQRYSLKKQTAGMSMHVRECMKLKIECLVVERREHLTQHYKKCLTRQRLRYRLHLL